MKSLLLSLALVCLLSITALAVPTAMTVEGIEGGTITFDPETGTITDGEQTITIAHIPDTINGVPVVAIGQNAFYECDALTTVTMGDSVETIGYDAFGFCTALTQVTLSNGLQETPWYLFRNCTALKSVVIPDGVTTLGIGLFSGCTALQEVKIPDTLTTVDAQVFHNCDSLVNLTLPNSVTTLGIDVFSKCDTLTSVTLPETITVIPKNAFYQCYSLSEIAIPEGVTSIGLTAFWDCTSLTSVTVPQSLETIGQSAFYDCPITHVYYGGTSSQWKAISIYDFNGAFESATRIYKQTEVYTPSSWAEAEVNGALVAGLVPTFTGNPSYTAAINRLQFAELIVTTVEAITQEEIAIVQENTFTDVDSVFVQKAVSAGIINGYSADTFSPYQTTNRQQIAAMITRAIDYIETQTGENLAPLEGDLSAFTDADSVSDFAQKAMARLNANGILNGTTTTTLSPLDTTSVQVSIVLLYRLYGLV